MPPRQPSVLVSVNAVVESVRTQRLKDLQALETTVQTTRQWLVATIESYKNQILESSGRVPVDACTKSPATKKHKSEHLRSLLPQHVVEEVKELKVKQLQAKLRQRGLDAKGVKKTLRQRLLQAFEEEYRDEMENKTNNSTDSNAKQDRKEMEPVEESKNVLVEKEKANEVSDEPAGERKQRSSRVMSVEMVDAFGNPVPLDDDAMDVDKKEPSAEVIAIRDESMREVSQDGGDVIEQKTSQDDVKQSAGYAKKRSVSPKRSRSPLRMMQSGVKAAIRKFSKSPKVSVDPKEESVEAKKSLMKIEPKVLEKEEPATMEADDVEQDVMPPPSKSSSSQQKSKVRLISTPALTSNASSSLSSTKSGTSVLKSQSGKAKTEARKAKIAEIRSKSKPVASSKPLTTPSLSSLKATSSSQTDSKRKMLAAQMREKAAASKGKLDPTTAASKAVETPAVAPTMSEAVKMTGETPASIAPAAKSSESTNSLSKTVGEAPASSEAAAKAPGPARPSSKTTQSHHESKTPGSTKSQQSEFLSPMDTYEMSDTESGDSDSDSDSGPRKPKKRIPSWAQKVNLVPALERQYTAGKHTCDPDEIFGEVQTCDLRAIFDQNKARYQRRTSSGNWAQDRATAAEKLTYKRTMGYAQKA